MIRKLGIVVRWGARGFGFLRELNEDKSVKEPLSEYFCHCKSVVGGADDLTIGTLVEFELHPNPKNNNGATPPAFFVRILNAGDVR